MKRALVYGICIFACLNAEPVRNLQAFDVGTGAAITSAWQNKTKQIRFTWKEPLAEIKAYKYTLGTTGKETLQESTEANSCLITIPQDGSYIFRVAAVDASGKISEERSLAINVDTTPPQTTVTVVNEKQLLIFTPEKPTTGAPLKGILFYYGTNPAGQPDRFCTTTADITPLIPRKGDRDYYINAALEDLAGNISAVQTLATLNGTEPALETGSPNMRIIGRTSTILNEKKELIPGAQIRYTLTLDNNGNAPAPLVELIDAIPLGTTYIANSAKSSRAVRIEFLDTSLNAGKGAWTQTPVMDTVKKIRWTYLDPFPTGKTPETIEYVVEANKI